MAYDKNEKSATDNVADLVERLHGINHYVHHHLKVACHRMKVRCNRLGSSARTRNGTAQMYRPTGAREKSPIYSQALNAHTR